MSRCRDKNTRIKIGTHCKRIEKTVKGISYLVASTRGKKRREKKISIDSLSCMDEKERKMDGRKLALKGFFNYFFLPMT